MEVFRNMLMAEIATFEPSCNTSVMVVAVIAVDCGNTEPVWPDLRHVMNRLDPAA